MRYTLYATIVCFALGQLAVAGPREEVMGMVPSDYTMCFVAQDLRGAAKSQLKLLDLRDGEKDPSPGIRALLQQEEGKKLFDALDKVLKQLGITYEQLRDDIFGDIAVFVYRQRPGAKDEQEEGLLLFHARDKDLLQKLIDKTLDAQTKSGEIKQLSEKKDGAVKYREMVRDGVREYFVVDGGFVAFSNNEKLLVESLKQREANRGAKSVALIDQMADLGVAKSPVAFLINPRSFDDEFAKVIKEGEPKDKAFMSQFVKYWGSVKALAFHVDIRDESLDIGLAVSLNVEELPQAGRQFLSQLNQASTLWQAIPDDAILAFAGRFDVKALEAMLVEFMPESEQKKLREQLYNLVRPGTEQESADHLIEGLGPNIGFWIAPPAKKGKDWLPQATLAIETKDTPQGREAQKAMLKTLEFYARLGVMSDRNLRLTTSKVDGDEVFSLTHREAFPEGFKPSLGAKGNYVLVTSSPQGIADFRMRPGAVAKGDDFPVLRFSTKSLKDYLEQRKDPLAKFIGEKNGMDPKAVISQIEEILPVIKTMDRIEIRGRSQGRSGGVVIRMVVGK